MIYNKTRLVATATGATLLATSAGLNVAASQDGGTPAVVAIIAVAIGTIVAVPAALYAWRSKRWVLAFVTVALLIAGEGFNGFNSVERLLAAREERASAVVAANAPFEMAIQRLRGAEDAYRSADAAVAAEARRGGCRRICQALRADAERALAEVESARAAYAETRPPREGHLVSTFTGWSASAIEIGAGLTFSIVLNGLGLALLAIGGHGSSVQVQQRRSEPRRSTSSGRRSSGTGVPRGTGSKPRPRASSASNRSEQVAEFCRAFRAQFGRDPTFTEVRSGTKFAKSTVSAALARVRSS
jgi:hypothetical protein